MDLYVDVDATFIHEMKQDLQVVGHYSQVAASCTYSSRYIIFTFIQPGGDKSYSSNYIIISQDATSLNCA